MLVKGGPVNKRLYLYPDHGVYTFEPFIWISSNISLVSRETFGLLLYPTAWKLRNFGNKALEMVIKSWRRCPILCVFVSWYIVPRHATGNKHTTHELSLPRPPDTLGTVSEKKSY